MNWELILILTSIMLFAYWLNYAMGSPLADNQNDVDVKAILFDFPQWLAIRRLKQFGEYDRYITQYRKELSLTSELGQKEKTRLDFKKNMFISGREFFTWERSLLCAICLHWWLSIIVGTILIWISFVQTGSDYFTGFLTYLVLHLVIRKIA